MSRDMNLCSDAWTTHYIVDCEIVFSNNLTARSEDSGTRLCLEDCMHTEWFGHSER